MLIIPNMTYTTHHPPNFLLPMYDTSFFTIFQAHHYAVHPMHDFHHPPTHHPPNFLLPHVWYIIFHNFSSLSLCWSSNAWLPPPIRHLPTQPPPTWLFISPCMIHYFLWFFKPNIMLIIPCMTSNTLPPSTQFFVSPCMIHHFSQFFKPIIADHPMHDFYHQTTNHPPNFLFPQLWCIIFCDFSSPSLLIIPWTAQFWSNWPKILGASL